MNGILEHQKEKMIAAMNASSQEYWKTLGEIADISAVKLEDVLKIVYTSGDFVESSSRTKYGQPVYTTRKLYQERTPFWRKLLAAARYTID